MRQPDICHVNTPDMMRIRGRAPLQQIPIHGVLRLADTRLGTRRESLNVQLPHGRATHADGSRRNPPDSTGPSSAGIRQRAERYQCYRYDT